jgi:hypothetical protein
MVNGIRDNVLRGVEMPGEGNRVTSARVDLPPAFAPTTRK